MMEFAIVAGPSQGIQSCLVNRCRQLAWIIRVVMTSHEATKYTLWTLDGRRSMDGQIVSNLHDMHSHSRGPAEDSGQGQPVTWDVKKSLWRKAAVRMGVGMLPWFQSRSRISHTCLSVHMQRDQECSQVESVCRTALHLTEVVTADSARLVENGMMS